MTDVPTNGYVNNLTNHELYSNAKPTSLQNIMFKKDSGKWSINGGVQIEK